MSTDTFRLHYLARTAAGVPRDLVNSLVVSRFKAIRPTVLIYNCTFVCDARCEMCGNWKMGDRKSDMTLEQLDGVMEHDFWGAIENLNISGGEPTTRNDLPEMVELFQRRLPRMRKIGINTTGLTPHRAIPMLTRIVKFCADAGPAAQRARVARRHRRHPQSGPPGEDAASTRPARRSRRCRRWPRSTRTSSSASPPRSSRRTWTTPRTSSRGRAPKKLDIVFNMLRFTENMLNNKELEEKIGFRQREEEFMRKFFLDRVAGRVGAERPVVHVPALRGHDRQRLPAHDAVPVPVVRACCSTPKATCSTARTPRSSATSSTSTAEALYFKAANLAHREEIKNERLSDLPESVPGQRRRDEAGRALREVPAPCVSGQARSGPASRNHSAGPLNSGTTAPRAAISRPAILRLAVAAALVCTSLRAPIPEVLQAFHRRRGAPLLIVVGLVLVDRALMAYRWFVLLRTARARAPALVRRDSRHLLRQHVSGTFLPGSIGGDAVRAYSLVEARRPDWRFDGVGVRRQDAGRPVAALMALAERVARARPGIRARDSRGPGATATICAAAALLVFSNRDGGRFADALARLPRRLDPPRAGADSGVDPAIRAAPWRVDPRACSIAGRSGPSRRPGVLPGCSDRSRRIRSQVYFAFVPLILLVMLFRLRSTVSARLRLRSSGCLREADPPRTRHSPCRCSLSDCRLSAIFLVRFSSW